ncbi:glycosyltransferase [Pedobacter sp.]|uniref:glycosyltransferase n=1 Tax=Pedobacter sp. TaxID=1411316 RepID=UPI0031CE043D
MELNSEKKLIVIATDYFFPNSRGGTEKYIHLLAKYLVLHYNIRILSIHKTLKYEYFDGLRIDYILPNTDNHKKTIKGLQAPNNLKAFEEYVSKQNPDIIHFHTLTSNFNIYHLKSSNSKNCKVYFTSHIPGHICLRGDFLQNGNTPCNGKISSIKCASCICFSSKGSLIKKITKYLYYCLTPNSPVKLKLKQLIDIERYTDKMISVSQWQKDFFIKNGIKSSHIEICRQASNKISINKSESNNIRLGFIGRIDPLKGLHLLLEAVDILRNPNIMLSIAAITPAVEHEQYYASLRSLSENILECKWYFNLEAQKLNIFFSDIDYLVVPSICFETGPFVIYEALAAGVPVITTNMGGQSELIEDGINGYLFNTLQELIKILSHLDKNKLTTSNLFHRKENMIGMEMQKIYR